MSQDLARLRVKCENLRCDSRDKLKAVRLLQLIQFVSSLSEWMWFTEPLICACCTRYLGNNFEHLSIQQLPQPPCTARIVTALCYRAALINDTSSKAPSFFLAARLCSAGKPQLQLTLPEYLTSSKFNSATPTSLGIADGTLR